MTKVGQIIPDKFKISAQITRLASLEDVVNIVEIGAWNGMGSTRCVLKGFSNKSNYLFKSYECFDEMYKEAIVNNKDFLNERFQIINGKIVDETEITNWFDVNELDSDQKIWLKQDLERMANVENVFNTIPDKIDLLILDGGEFSTYKEWLLLNERFKYIVLDDTKCLKSKKIREEILGSRKYEIIEDDLNERNGFLIAKRGQL